MGSSGSSSLVSCPANPQLVPELARQELPDLHRVEIGPTPGAESRRADGRAGRCCRLMPLPCSGTRVAPVASFPWDRL